MGCPKCLEADIMTLKEKGQMEAIKATKEEVLLFIRDREWLTIHDLMEQFGYRYKGAEKRLYRLAREGLATPWIERGQWTLTQDGFRRLEYYEQRRKQLEAGD